MSLMDKSTLRTEAVFSEDRKHRYLLKKEWDKNKKKALVIMKNPSSADTLALDLTIVYVINNLSKLDYGSVDIVNIFSKISTKLSMRGATSELVGDENDEQIAKAASKADTIIIAWGKVGETSNRVKLRQEEVLKLIEEHQDKFYKIEEEGFHPLSPQIRHGWDLKKFNTDEIEVIPKEPKIGVDGEAKQEIEAEIIQDNKEDEEETTQESEE